MQITVDIPDEYIESLAPNGIAADRALLEASVTESYRQHRLTLEQVRALLGFGTRMQANEFLLSHEIFDYTTEDFESDMATLNHLLGSMTEQGRA